MKLATNKVPYADFSYTPDDPVRSHEILFLDASEDYEDGVLLFSWDFGDGNTSKERNPEHAYAASGEYVVTLTVEDEDGNIDDRVKTISIVNKPPIADFQVVPPNPGVDHLAQFIDASSDPESGALIYEWKFGDGTFKYTQNPTHIYGATGTYNVKLTVTDDEGLSSTKTMGIQVIRKYELVIEVKDSIGSPIGGTEVSVYKSGDLFTIRNTDSRGKFTLYDIPEGNYRVVAKNLMLESDIYITVDRDMAQTLIVKLSIMTAGLYSGVFLIAIVLFVSKDKIMELMKKR